MKLSVAMCTYNGAKYIREQLESIINQELPVDEIVVCDDGSKDDTLAIIKDIAANNPQIQWKIQQNSPNIGVTKNFEKALTLCTGDIIFLSDQDDVWRKDKTKVIVDYFNNYPNKSVVFTDAELIDENDHPLSKYGLLDSTELLQVINLWNEGYEYEIFASSNRATGATMAVRRPFLEKVLPFATFKGCLHDEQLAITAIIYNSLGLIQDRLISYRQHKDNVIGISASNWVFTDGECKSLKNKFIFSTEIKSPFLKHFKKANSHLQFYLMRSRKCHTAIGKIQLLLHIHRYFKEYNRYWYRCLYSDVRCRCNLRVAFGIKK